VCADGNQGGQAAKIAVGGLVPRAGPARGFREPFSCHYWVASEPLRWATRWTWAPG